MRRGLVLLTAAIGCGGAPSPGTGASEATTATTTDGPATTGPTGSSTAAPTTTTGEPLAPGECASPIEPVLLASARLGLDAAGRLHDEHGRDVLLRGVNTGGRSKWAPFVPFPVDAEIEQAAFEAAAQEFFARLPGWGINVVRLLFSWEALEPTPGQYDARYLDRYAAMVDVAWSHGLRVIVDFHQDIYTSTYCGDGFPPWTLPQDPPPEPHTCPDADWGLKYVLDGDVRAAFDRFWADEDGLHAKFFAMWGQMIARVGDHPGVVGLEILNEPGSGTAGDIPTWKHETLNPFHTEAVAQLRALAGDELLILFNNPGTDAIGFQPIEHVRPEGSGLVYAAHMYDAGLVKGLPSVGMMPEPYLDDIADFAAAEGLGVLIGEFGYGHGATGAEEWLTRALDQMDARRLSGTLWECSQNEVAWNGEDLSVLAADGSELDSLDVFVRPYLRAVAGTDSAFSWDQTTATASWTGDGGVSEIALPQRRFDGASLDIELTTLAGPEGACYTLDPSRGELRVQAPDGAQVEVRVTVAD
ncbi:cellulase family glycosylhydrolase [Nannocystis punicea]|uniref:Cellulase family glycosylhydrolase n=1 Tax=Nannocystis punicea TaxID=2995304 RepID=A0ABY7H6M9_9BACT|nr:cellulase family glycosylhydrolase [Nannocystis poenicansa]WAS94928.1 cellulase family glycosylhydrolase [Nannocystis poenicansa]